MNVKFECIKPLSVLPERDPRDAGIDLFTCKPVLIEAGKSVTVPLGVKCHFPEGYYGVFKDRSSMSVKGIHVLAGVIDQDYRGELKAVLINLSDADVMFEAETKVCQMLILPQIAFNIVQGDVNSDETKRGDKGFGSTGS